MITKKHKTIALIQLFLVRSFLYSLTYCVKEVIKGNIFWRLNEESVGLWGSYGLKQRNPLKFFKTLIRLYLFYLFLYFWLTLSKRVSKAICLYINLKSVGLWGSYGLKQGNPLQKISFLIKLYLVLLNGSKRLSEVRSFEIKWIYRPMR